MLQHRDQYSSSPALSYRPERARLLRHLRDKEGLTGTDDALVPEHQLFLLGGNPLPILISILALEPQVAHVLSTPEVKQETLDALEAALQARVAQNPSRAPIRLQRYAPCSAVARAELRSRLDQVRSAAGTSPLGLNYTGGTKVMAAQALVWWQEDAIRGQAPDLALPLHRCSYLWGHSDALHLDGCSHAYPLKEISISLEALIRLHGWRFKPPGKDKENPTTQVKHAPVARILGELAFSPSGGWAAVKETLPPLYGIKLLKLEAKSVRSDLQGTLRLESAVATHSANFKSGAYKDWKLEPFCALHADLKQALGPGTAGLKVLHRDPDKAIRYLCIDWFEEWLFLRLKTLSVFKNLPEFFRNVELQAPGVSSSSKPTDTELDILGMIGHTPLLISCTTQTRASETKLKAMEALLRAQQLGGELARFVMAFWGDSAQLEELYLNLRSHWTAPPRFRVLGLAHYQDQADFTHLDQNGRPVHQTLDELFSSWMD